MKKAFLTGMCAAAAIALMSPFAASQGGKKSDSVVKVKAKLDKAPAGKAVVVLTLDIQPGWHLYANPVGLEDLESSQVVVKFANAAAKIEYPVGKVITDVTLGNYNVYEDTVAIRATIDRAAGDTSPIEITVRLQACDAKTCLPPATVKVSVP